MRLPAVQFGPAPLINPPTPNICSIDLLCYTLILNLSFPFCDNLHRSIDPFFIPP